MTILITNDDGPSRGAELLLKAAQQIDKNAYALLPSKQRSAVSKALTLHKPVRLKKLSNNVFTLSGTPADCVSFALYSNELPKPTLVLSGVNFGDNTAMTAILSSGTVGAAWQGTLHHIPSLAFSLYIHEKDWSQKDAWPNEEEFVSKLVELIKDLRGKLKPDHFFNINLPKDVSKSKVVFNKNLQRQRFKTTVMKGKDPNGDMFFWMGGDFSKIEKDTDSWEVAKNKNISVTEIYLHGNVK